jgi:hypothetical protein
VKDRAVQAAVLSLCLLPLIWLWPSVFGGRTFVPYDLAEFPPASLLLTSQQYEATHDGANHDVTEPPPWFVPEMKLAGAELRSGHLPTWDPHARTGAPLHAHGLIGLCYPPNWIALFATDPQSRLVVLAWISLALGGLFAFGLLRRVGLCMLSAWFGAMVFQLSGPMAANSFFWMRLASYVWLPGVLWALLCLARGDRMRPLPLSAVAVSFAMTWLGGFPPFAITTSVFAGFLLLWLVGERVVAGARREAARLGLRLGCGLLLGALLAMPQVLPSMQFFAQSARTVDPKFAEIAESAFETYGLSGYLVPDLVSHPTSTAEMPYALAPMALLLNTRHADGKQAKPNYNYTEYAVFVGTLGFLLACAGAVRGRGQLRRFAITAFVLSAGLALFLPGVNLLFLLPVIKNVVPMRWLAPATLVVAWLAALGFDRLRENTRRLPLALAGVAFGLAGLVLYATSRPAADPAAAVQCIAQRFGVTLQAVVDYVHADHPSFDRFERAFEHARHEGQQAAAWLAIVATLFAGLAFARGAALRQGLLLLGCGLTVLQLGWHGATVTRGVSLQPAETDVHRFLRERVHEEETKVAGGFAIVRASVEPTLPAQLPPGQLMVPGIRDVHFYTHYDAHSAEPILQLLGPRWGPETAAKGYLEKSLPDTLPTPAEAEAVKVGTEPAVTYAFASPLEHPLLDLLGVRYVLATEALAHAGKRVGPELRGPRGEFFVYERPRPLPRAFTVNELRPLPTDAEVVRALVDPGFQPRAVAYVLAADLTEPAPPRASQRAQRTVRFVTDLATAVELDVGAGTAPWLVLADTFLPGWVATIDGVETPILRVNHSQRAVSLPAGACHVHFAYTCPGLRMGTMLAGIATTALLAAALYSRHRGRTSRAQDTQALMQIATKQQSAP